MAYDFKIQKLAIQTELFGKSTQLYEIVCDGAALSGLCSVLRSVVGEGKRRPISSLEQDVLSDLYNSISLYKLKRKL